LSESFLRRAVVMVFGFVLAAGAGAALLPIAALIDPAIRELSFEAALGFLFDLFQQGEGAIDPGVDLVSFADLFRTLVVAVCVAPLAAVALLGEIAGQRSWLWHAAGCGFLAAAAPWIARVAHHSPRAHAASPLELRIAALLFLVGVATGTVYWLIAARRPRASAPPP